MFISVFLIITAGCGKPAAENEKKLDDPSVEKVQITNVSEPDLMLAQAQFIKKTGDDGRRMKR